MKNKKIILIFALIIILIILIGIVSYISKKENILLIQLSSNSNTQMMGYIIKTTNNKVIAIDGGYTTDVDNFVKYINKYGGKVDFWFLTHAHNDHASVILDVINNKKLEIGTIYASLNDKEWYEKNEYNRSNFSKELIDAFNKEEIRGKVKSPSLNEKLEIDGIQVEILGIKNPEITENSGNEQSMVIKFDTGETKLLFLGDTGKNSSKKLLENQKEKLKSDYVQMAHHGQARSNKRII